MRIRIVALAALLAVAAFAPPANGGCGCDKPPPPLATVRPFVGHFDQAITIFDDRLVPGTHYAVQFVAMDGSTDWSMGKAVRARDLADRVEKAQLGVRVGNVSLGPCALKVWDGQNVLLAVDDAQFTVVPPPVALYDYDNTFTRPDYRTAVGRDGTFYLPVDVSQVTTATSFYGVATGFPMRFDARDVAIWNDQGFLMQLLDPEKSRAAGMSPNPLVLQKTLDNLLTNPLDTVGSLLQPGAQQSSVMTYWRHEFATYKDDHRKEESLATEADTNWHVAGSPHVDHDHLVIAIRGRLSDGRPLPPGPTPTFDLELRSEPDPAPPGTSIREGESSGLLSPVTSLLGTPQASKSAPTSKSTKGGLLGRL